MRRRRSTTRTNTASALMAWLYLATPSDAGGPLSPPPLQSVLETVGGDVGLSGRVLLQTQSGGLTLIRDLNMPCDPGVLPPASGARGPARVEAFGPLVAVTSPDSGVRLLDLSDPAAPVELAVVDLPGEELHAVIDNSFLYILVQQPPPSSGQAILRVPVFDPTNPGSPQLVLLPPIGVEQFSVQRGVLAHPLGLGLRFYTLRGRDPAEFFGAVFFIGGLPEAPSFMGPVAVVPVVGIAPSRIDLLDLSDPKSIGSLGSISVEGQISDHVLVGSTVYLALRQYDIPGLPEITPGVLAVDLSDTDNPVSAWFLETEYQPDRLDLRDGVLVVVGPDTGPHVYADEACTPFTCGPADLAPPLGVLNFNDLTAFLNAFADGDPAAELAPPDDTLTFSDVIAYLQAFSLGCPG